MERETGAPAALKAREGKSASREATGLLAGTLVMTLDGELPVEHLAPGDRIITRDAGMAVLRAVRITPMRLAPIEVRAGSLGHTRPDRTTRLAPGARVHIRDWRAKAIYGTATADIPARRLTDGEFISEAPVERVCVHDLVFAFDQPHILYADGLEVASAAA